MTAPTVASVLDDYLREHVSVKCVAAERQETASEHLKAFFGTTRPLTTVNVPLSRSYAAARHVSPATVRRELSVLVAAANHAAWMGRTTHKIQIDLPADSILDADAEAPFLSKAEIAALFAETARIDGELPHFVNLLYWTGARRRSIENLTRDQVRVDQRRILLRPAHKRATKKRQPIVPIFRQMTDSVDWLLARNRPFRLFERTDFYRPFHAAMRTVGIPEGRRHPHVLRHSRATHLLQDGKSIYDVAKLLGDTIGTVERVYGHHSIAHLADLLD